jgi:outer membrane murein-binding lipoprotein Lpp
MKRESIVQSTPLGPRRVKVAAVLLLLFMGGACSNRGNTRQVDDIRTRVASLERQVASLQKDVIVLQDCLKEEPDPATLHRVCP